MSIEDLRAAEDAISATLADQETPISAGSLIGTLTGRGFGEEAARVAMWNLIDGGEIILTPNRKLDLPDGARARRWA